jgi:hypothetical protein
MTEQADSATNENTIRTFISHSRDIYEGRTGPFFSTLPLWQILDDKNRELVQSAFEREAQTHRADTLLETLRLQALDELIKILIAPQLKSGFEHTALSIGIRRLAEEEDWEYLETFVTDSIEHGVTEAQKRWKKEADGSHKRSFSWAILVSSCEISFVSALFWMMRPGFESTVISLIVLIGAQISWQVSGVIQLTHLLTIPMTLDDPKKLRFGKLPSAKNPEQTRLEVSRNLARDQGLQLIRSCKMCIVEGLACILLLKSLF